MKSHSVESLKKQVYRRFPEFTGVRPKIKPFPRTESSKGPATYQLTFRLDTQVANGRRLVRWLRVIADDGGKIIKITTSK